MDRPALRRTLLVSGLVQGVGFRPYVYRLATEHLLGGWVLNDTRGVTICIEGPIEAADLFGRDLLERLPALARIDSCKIIEESPIKDWSTSFDIRHSAGGSGRDALVMPDAHVCADCRQELFDPEDRRHGYPLINCTNCGPRYSIIRDIPYDRPLTTMAPFVMCAACQREYDAPDNRRFHAQPNACWACGPKVKLLYPDGKVSDEVNPVKSAAALLMRGRILAVKALGGYQIMADPANGETVDRLRKSKERSAKPFALLALDVATVAKYAHCDEREARLLESPGRPIVLLKARADNPLSAEVAPKSPTLGFMLPATPLQYLLLAASRDVLIATSGNAVDEPMVRTEEDAVRDLCEVVDGVLTHDREIHTRVDDSIARIVHSQVAPKITFLRRARGYAPDPVPAPFPVAPVLALGAELKNTVCVGKGSSLYLSQHIGDLKTVGNQQFFSQTIGHLQGITGVTPRYVAHDLHPDFYSTQYAASCRDATIVGVQHHHAHMAACMADNGLDQPVIGVVFDGTGYGTDGTIWGGEFLVGDYSGFERQAHLRRFRLPGGDKAIKEPYRIAVGLLTQLLGEEVKSLPLDMIRDRDPFEIDVLMKMSARGIHAPETSSMGRMFDAVSALIGVCTSVGYEGQAAIELEHLLDWDLTPAKPWPLALQREDGRLTIDHGPWLRALLDDLTGNHLTPAQISRRFHESVVLAITEVCLELSKSTGIKDIVLSGGVFLNQYLLVRAEHMLTGAGIRVHTHSRVPTNDGGIAVGQAMVAAARARRDEAARDSKLDA
jgi:hydrogenase maturation protein HypF